MVVTGATMPVLALLVALCAWSPPARAASFITVPELEARLGVLVPKVEAATGQRFYEIPRLAVATREEVIAVDRRIRSRYLGERADEGRDYTRRVVERSVAVYLPTTRTIYLIDEALAGLFSGHSAGASLLRPALDAMLAHELTHALQDQILPFGLDLAEDERDAALLMHEGQANLVMHELCADPATANLLASLQGIDSLSSADPEDPVQFTYGYGERFVRAIRDRIGTAGLWWAMSQPPPSREEVMAVVGPSLLQGWRDPAPLAEVGRALSAGGWAATSGRASAFALAETLHGDVQDLGAATAEAGLFWEGAGPGDAALTVLAFSMDTPALAERWLSVRESQMRAFNERDAPFYGLADAPLRVGRLKGGPSSLRGAPARTLGFGFVATRARPSYREHWLARGRTLVGLAAIDHGIATRKIERALLDLLAAMSERGPASAPADLLARWTPPADLPALGVSIEYTFRTVLWDYEQSAWVPCASRAVRSGPASTSKVRQGVIQLGYKCALASGDMGAASALLALVAAPDDLPEQDRLEHARQLIALGRVHDALGLVESIDEVSSDQAELLAVLRLALAYEQRDLRAIAAAARDPALPADQRFMAADLLARMGSWSSAASLLRATCPALEGAQRRKCELLLDDLRP